MKSVSPILLNIINVCALLLLILFIIAYVQLGISNVETSVGPSWSMFAYFTSSMILFGVNNYMKNYINMGGRSDGDTELSNFLPKMKYLLEAIESDNSFTQNKKLELKYMAYSYYIDYLNKQKDKTRIDKLLWYLKNTNNDLSDFTVIDQYDNGEPVIYNTQLKPDGYVNKLFIRHYLNKKENMISENLENMSLESSDLIRKIIHLNPY